MALVPWDTNAILTYTTRDTRIKKESLCSITETTAPGNAGQPFMNRRSRRTATVYNGKPTPRHWSPPSAYGRSEGRLVYPQGAVIGTSFGTEGCPSYPLGVTYTLTQNYEVRWLPTPIGDGPYSVPLLNQTTTKLLLSLKNEGEASLGLALLERKETENMFISALKKISSGVAAYRKHKPKDWARVLRSGAYRNKLQKEGRLHYRLSEPPPPNLLRRPLSPREKRLMAVPESYLEMQYGWKPFMKDVSDAVKAVDYAQSNQLYTFSHKSRSSSTDYFDIVIFTVLGNMPATLKCRVTQRCLIRVDYVIDTSILATAAALGLTNPAALIVERVPFSFVLDWAIPIGDFLNQFDATLGKLFKGGSVTNSSSRAMVDFLGPAGFTSAGIQYRHLITQDPTYYHWNFDRYVLNSFPSPAPPAFKNPCSPTHVANAIALCTTAFFGKVPRGVSR